MIVWLNGTFGVGKTATAASVIDRDPSLRLFDPEWVGYMLKANLRDREIQDFQDIPAWRTLVPVVAHELAELTGQRLLAVQTVLAEGYWSELRAGLERLGHEVFHIVLDAQADVIRARAEADTIEQQATEWRIAHIPTYAAARSWMLAAADLVIDTTDVTAEHAAALIRAAV